MAKAKYKQVSLTQLQEIVLNSTSFSEVMRQLGYKIVILKLIIGVIKMLIVIAILMIILF